MTPTSDFRYLVGHRVKGGEAGFLAPFSLVVQPVDAFSGVSHPVGNQDVVLLPPNLGARIREESSSPPSVVLAALGGPPRHGPRKIRTRRGAFSFVKLPDTYGFSVLLLSERYVPVMFDIDETTSGDSSTEEVTFARVDDSLSASVHLLPSTSYRFKTGATALIVRITKAGQPVPGALLSLNFNDPDIDEFRFVARTDHRGRATLLFNHVVKEGLKAVNGFETEPLEPTDMQMRVFKGPPESIDEFHLIDVVPGSLTEESIEY